MQIIVEFKVHKNIEVQYIRVRTSSAENLESYLTRNILLYALSRALLVCDYIEGYL